MRAERRRRAGDLLVSVKLCAASIRLRRSWRAVQTASFGTPPLLFISRIGVSSAPGIPSSEYASWVAIHEFDVFLASRRPSWR